MKGKFGNKKADYTEYGRWTFDGKGAWCAAFVSWCANMAGVPGAEKSTSSKKDYGKPDRRNFGAKFIAIDNSTKASEYRKGDILMCSWEGDTINHVEIVYNNPQTDGEVLTISGNADGELKVVKRTSDMLGLKANRLAIGRYE